MKYVYEWPCTVLGTWCWAHGTRHFLRWSHPQLQHKFWPRGEDAHSFQGVQNRRGLFPLLSFNLQQIKPLLQSNLFVASGLMFGRLPALFQADFPNINICQEHTQSQGCKNRFSGERRMRAVQAARGETGGRLELAGQEEEQRSDDAEPRVGGKGCDCQGGVWIFPMNVSTTILQNLSSL